MKKKSILPIIIGILLLTIGGICTYIITNESRKGQQKTNDFELIYDDEGEPGHKYNITIHNETINIKKTSFCSIPNCKETTSEENFIYSNKNMIKLSDFIKNNFQSNKKIIEINSNSLTPYQLKIINSIILGEKYFELDIEPYEYLLIFDESETRTYYTYFKKNNNIIVKIADTNNITNELKSVNTKKLNFSKKYKDILFNYIKKQKLDKENIFNRGQIIYKDEKLIYDSIINFNEHFLSYYENEPKLAYTITYNGINCPTPEIRLYSDNTYELFDTFSTNPNHIITPKTGKYNYDIEKIIKNSSKTDKNESKGGPFIITDKDGKEYTIYDNKELDEFFNSINVSITRCTTEAKKKLLFSLESTLLKCPSPILKVYDDNTYELYDTNRSENTLSKSGTYNYNINNILNDIGQYEVDSDTTMILTDSDGYSHYLNNYEPLNQFLKSINIDINRCS